MIRFLPMLLSILALLAFVGCKPSGGGATSQPSAPAHPPHDGHDHDHAAGDDHDHDHDHDHGHGHGAPKELGSARVGDFEVRVTQFGDVVAGKEATIGLTLMNPADASASSLTVRVWIGTEDGAQSVKSKAEREADGSFHAHVEVPSPLPAASAWWVEIEGPSGITRSSVALPG